MNDKIFISSSGVNNNKVEDSISYLAEKGIKNIELSGGCKYEINLKKKLLKLKKKYDLNYLIHNYFPPPKVNFVLNIGSCNDVIYEKTIKFYENALDLCKDLGINRYGIHSGFLIDIKSSELGKKIKKRKLYLKSKSINRLIKGYSHLRKYSQGKVNIFLENNVITKNNLLEYGLNPLLFTPYSDYLSLKKKFNFKILLDLAHLKVSTKTLGIDFLTEVKKFKKHVEYIHVSGNNSLRDSNNSICNDNKIKEAIKILKNAKIITLEIYENIDLILKSKKVCEKLIIK